MISVIFKPLDLKIIFNSSGVINFFQLWVPLGNQPRIYSAPTMAKPKDNIFLFNVAKKSSPFFFNNFSQDSINKFKSATYKVDSQKEKIAFLEVDKRHLIDRFEDQDDEEHILVEELEKLEEDLFHVYYVLSKLKSDVTWCWIELNKFKEVDYPFY